MASTLTRYERKPRAEIAPDDDSKAIIYEGANQTQLSRLFNISAESVKAKLHSVKPDGERSGYPVWKISTAAPYLSKPMGNFEEALSRMDPRDLPKELSKTFWDGMRAKQDYERAAGDLWPTVMVVEKVGKLFKLFRMALLLAVDTIERTTELTDRQKSLFKSICDGVLRDLLKAVREDFPAAKPSTPVPSGDDDEF